MARAIAFYLPQFYPTIENDTWWYKGFTEWTNVGDAKPLFKGHYQPRVPKDLSYYDLRVPEVREQQAELARQAGIEGFCYWHYWFNGRRLLDRVFSEVVKSGKPDYPFCLCWANHSWFKKKWQKGVQDELLLEQTYPGKEDYTAQFNAMLPAFKDSRYIKVEGRLLYGIFNPSGVPDMGEMMQVWNELAVQNGLKGFYFFAFAQGMGNLDVPHKEAYNAVVYDPMFDTVFINNQRLGEKVKAKICTILNRPKPLLYSKYSQIAMEMFNDNPDTTPCIVPNFDHSPRSRARSVILHESTPELWGELCKETSDMVNSRQGNNLLFIKSWNEWGEGNYLEPDLRFGTEYIEETAKALKNK